MHVSPIVWSLLLEAFITDNNIQRQRKTHSLWIGKWSQSVIILLTCTEKTETIGKSLNQ